MENEESKFMGRKVFFTGATVAATVLLAYLGKMTPDVALVFTGAIASFNYALRNSG